VIAVEGEVERGGGEEEGGGGRGEFVSILAFFVAEGLA